MSERRRGDRRAGEATGADLWRAAAPAVVWREAGARAPRRGGRPQ